MTEEMIDIEGLVVPLGALRIPRAVELTAALANRACTYASLVECHSANGREAIVFDVEVERPQHPVHDIRRIERVAGRFDARDNCWPEALALRADFPVLPHLNMQDTSLPRSLCLYDRPWGEVRLNWSAAGFIERVRWWLARTARGELHTTEQALEPLMFSHGFDLVVQSGFGLDDQPTVEVVRVVLVDGKEGRVLVAARGGAGEERGGLSCVTMCVDTPPRTHGVIHQTPKTLGDLAELVDWNQFSLLDQLRQIFRELPDEIRQRIDVRRSLRPLIVVGLPKVRRDGGKVEWVELKGFLCADNVERVGVDIGAWEVAEDTLGQPLTVDARCDGSSVNVIVVNVVRRLTWERAAWANGVSQRNVPQIVGIGAGALGSQVAMNLARAGFGKWTVVDYDALMPHNLARHALEGDLAMGHNKAMCVALYMNSITDDEQIARGVPADFLRPGDYAPDLDSCVGSADIVLDMSASVPVGREIASRDVRARGMSLFMSPSGRDLVLLAEDEGRTVRLDGLEMLYYKAIATDARLDGHLDSAEGVIRYGVSCRDVSSRMAQAHVAVHAGIGASAIRRSVSVKQATASVWRIEATTMEVRAVELALDSLICQRQGRWTLYVGAEVLGTVSRMREEWLPNETGGILLGGIDQDRRRMYILLALPSPPDSEEWPTMYIRGVKGLREARERIVERTAGNLDYLGEWHSHPRNSTTEPSADDQLVFSWIRDHVSGESGPGVVLICGDGGNVRVFVEELTDPLPEPLRLA